MANPCKATLIYTTSPGESVCWRLSWKDDAKPILSIVAWLCEESTN